LPQNRQLTAQEIRDEYIAYEGLGECIWGYIPADMIGDKRLEVLWREAHRAMVAIIEYLETVPEPSRRRVLGKTPPKEASTLAGQSGPLDDFGEEMEEAEL
jgi:hypothetical protein